MIWRTPVSALLNRHNVLKSFGNAYGESVLLTVILNMYVQYFPAADQLICVVTGICGIPKLSATQFDELPNVLEPIFRDRRPSGN